MGREGRPAADGLSQSNLIKGRELACLEVGLTSLSHHFCWSWQELKGLGFSKNFFVVDPVVVVVFLIQQVKEVKLNILSQQVKEVKLNIVSNRRKRSN